MERLTFEGNFCDIAQCRELPCPYGNSCSQRKVWERLKEYEDAGMPPKAVDNAREVENRLNEGGYSISRMVELMRADKDGCVVMLPCKVGDTVYTLFCGEVIEKRIRQFYINGYTNPRIWADLDCDFMSTRRVRWDLSVGKDFFLTREEVEKALEERKDGRIH